jgi:hypothetical protein
MSRLTKAISGVAALAVISCAAQLALGRDLTPALQDRTHPPIDQPVSSPTSLDTVNRGTKSDRAAGPAGSPALTRTVSLKLDGFSTTSFLLRVPMADGKPSSVAPAAKAGARRPMVACEPVVSVLTEVVRQLQPGRCVT